MDKISEKKMTPVPKDSMILRFLYETIPGRMILRPFLFRGPSKLAGNLLDTGASRLLIPFFLKKGGIDLSEYLPEEYPSFNACFSRRIRPELRPVDPDPEKLVSPCDGLLSVYPITDGLVIPVKHCMYSIAELLRNRELARQFEGGTCLVFRLCVNHYHRYCYPLSGKKSVNVKIPGIFHTVQPIALKNRPVFVENSREYTVISNPEFGKSVMMEVGALLVGKIANHHPEGREICRGEEKGTFLYGGSTIILLLQKDQAVFPEYFFETSDNQMEIPVKLGQVLGVRSQTGERV